MPATRFRRTLARLLAGGAAVAGLVSGCALPSAGLSNAGAPPKPGIAFHTASYQPCLACERVAQRDPLVPPLYLKQRPLLTSDDIDRIVETVDSGTDQPALGFAFRPEARARVLAATTDHVGETSAWVMQDEVFYMARISGPFSDSMQLSGLDRKEQARVFGLLTGIKEPRRIRDAAH